MGKGQTKTKSELAFSMRGNMETSLEKVSSYLNQGLAWIAGTCLVLMMLLVVINALVRSFSTPFYGAAEMVGLLGALTTAFALGYTQLHKGHVEIDVLVDQLPSRLKRWIRGFMLLVSTSFFFLTTWKVFLYALMMMDNGNLSETMRIAFYPFIILFDVGLLGLSLALLVEFLKMIQKGYTK